VAFNWAPLSAVPDETGAGVFQVTVGVALVTVMEFLAVAEVALLGSLGVKVALNVWVPAARIVPAAGEYVNVP
jgi:hypothetical protein